MSSNGKVPIDVFVSSSVMERETALRVEKALHDAGFNVLSARNIADGEAIQEAIWRMLAKADAIVAIMPPESVPPSNVAVELGAAMAWQKPLYLVYRDAVSANPPPYLASYFYAPVSRLDDVIADIKERTEVPADIETERLKSTYRSFGMPADRLSLEPFALEQFAREFNVINGSHFDGEELLHRLLTLRKHGKLPKVKRPKKTA